MNENFSDDKLHGRQKNIQTNSLKTDCF